MIASIFFAALWSIAGAMLDLPLVDEAGAGGSSPAQQRLGSRQEVLQGTGPGLDIW